MKITPMDKSFNLFRCIHVGPLSPSNIEKMSMKRLSEEQLDRNKKFLARLTDTYGSCAMLAIENGFVVAHARFYPQIIFELAGKKHLCCQEPKFAITQQMVKMVLPTLEILSDRIIRSTVGMCTRTIGVMVSGMHFLMAFLNGRGVMNGRL